MLNKIQTLSASEAVAQRLLEMIQSGVYKPGDRLPTEDELSAAFGVGRSSIREAKSILIAKNLLESGSGKGTYVRAVTIDEAVSYGVLHHLLEQETALALQEAREMFEIRSVELAVLRADDDDLEELAIILETMRKAAQEGNLAYQAGLDFHLALVNATHNQVFVKLYEIIAELLKVHQEVDYSTSADPITEYEEHRILFEALKRRDLEDAVALMQSHLEYVRDVEENISLNHLKNDLQ